MRFWTNKLEAEPTVREEMTLRRPDWKEWQNSESGPVRSCTQVQCNPRAEETDNGAIWR